MPRSPFMPAWPFFGPVSVVRFSARSVFFRVRIRPCRARPIGSCWVLSPLGPVHRPRHLPARPVFSSCFPTVFRLSIEFDRGSVFGLLFGFFLPPVYARLEPCLPAATPHLLGLTLALGRNLRSLRHRCRGISSSSATLVLLVIFSVARFAAATVRLSGLTWALVADRRSL